MELKKRAISGEGSHCYATAEGIFNNTWGHLAPKKNTTYKGHIIIMQAQHGEYGWGTLILSYDFEGITGPYTHDDIMRKLSDNVVLNDDDTNIYKVEISFRNYVYYFGKSKAIAKIN